jgi:spermidine dehydrogenase
MSTGITRRDFMNGIAMTIVGTSCLDPVSAAPTQLPAAFGAPQNYPPALSGLRGSHVGSFEAAHRLRDGTPFDLSRARVEERYDLVVVGAGISGLASAYFYRQR